MMPKLSEIFTLQMGKTPARAKNEYWNNGDNDWVSISDLSTYDKYVGETKETISDLAVMESGIKPAPADTVIMSFKLSLGKTAITVKPIYTNEAIMAFIPNGNYPVHTSYFYHFFVGYDWSNGTNRAVMGSTLNKATLSEIEITVPSIMEQIEIAKCLDKIDALISLRKQQLSKLDELVKSRFIEMFGTETEFDRWECCTIGDVSDVCVGVVIKPTQYYSQTGIPAFRSLNIGEMRVKDDDWVYFTEEGHQKNQKSIIRENDVLVVRSGAPGTACVATKKYDGYNAIDIIIAHPDNSKVNSVFLAAFTNMPHGMNQIREGTGGAAQQHFNVGGYKSMSLILPPLELQNEFEAFVKQTDKSKLEIQKSLEKLETLKKALMQKYFG